MLWVKTGSLNLVNPGEPIHTVGTFTHRVTSVGIT